MAEFLKGEADILLKTAAGQNIIVPSDKQSAGVWLRGHKRVVVQTEQGEYSIGRRSNYRNAK